MASAVSTVGYAADSDASADVAVQVLQLVLNLYAAHDDPLALRVALKACGEWLGCSGLLNLQADDQPLDLDALEALAGRVTHCAAYGALACGSRLGDPLRRARCTALAPHLHQFADAARNALRATFFEQLQPTWVLDRRGRVRDSNSSAKAMTAPEEPLVMVDGQLAPAAPGGGAHLRRTLVDLDHETCFSWVDVHGFESTLLLRPLPAGAGIAATLLPEPPTATQLAPLLAQRLKLTPREGELAANLLTGETLSGAARAMDISRNTANEHLALLLRRVGVPDRKALFAILRRAVMQ